jgi:hypothetical protein
LLVAINEHADTIHLVAADGSQDAVIVLQDNVGVVAKYRLKSSAARTAVCVRRRLPRAS